MSLAVQKCAKCPTLIFMARSRSTGKPMPVDAEPAPNGNVLLTNAGGTDWIADVLGKLDAAAARANGDSLRLNHFVTCPAAAHFRKPKAGAR